jgi:hypothetical protein
MDNIINHANHPTVSTYNTKVAAGTVNPFDIRTYKQIININSRFRNNYTTTPASDFYFTMATPIKKAISMKLQCINLPNIIYTVNKNTGSDNFTISQSGSQKIITIESGAYTPSQIVKQTNTKLVAAGFPNISLNYNLINGKMNFSSTTQPFDISFDYIDPSGCSLGHNIYRQVGSNLYKDQLTLGWLLGFRQNYQFRTPINAIAQSLTNRLHNLSANPVSRKELRTLHSIHSRRPRLTQVKTDGFQYLEDNYNCCDVSGLMMYPNPLDISYTYINDTEYTAEAIYDSHGNRHFLLSINDFQNNHTTAVVSPLQQETLGDGCIIAKISSACCGGCSTEHIDRIYFGPTEISRIHIKLLDEFGRILDLNNGDYSLTLEFEILYDL